MAAFADHAPDRRPDLSLFQSVARFAAAAIVVVVAATALPFVGEYIAQDMGWHRSFVGTIFIALATTIPEIVVSIAAIRIGALNMAVANLLGSNLFYYIHPCNRRCALYSRPTTGACFTRTWSVGIFRSDDD